MNWTRGMLWGLLAIVPLQAGHAQSVEALEAQLRQTQQQLSQLQQKIQQAQSGTRKAQSQALSATRMLVKAQQYPAAFWSLRNVLQGQSDTAFLLAATARAQGQRLATLQQKHQKFFQLYAPLQQQQAELQAVAEAIRQTEGRRQRYQRAALASAGRDASRLALTLQAALQEEKGPNQAALALLPDLNIKVSPPPATSAAMPRVRPVQGRVVVGFRQGEGAEREGVVLAAPAGARVLSPVGGKVLFAEGFRQFGGMVIVEGSDGHEELLGGLGALNVLAGQQVKPGQALGEVGPRQRVYWEMRVRGAVRNPLQGLQPNS